jgi:Protein of unknown function (DUF3592)
LKRLPRRARITLLVGLATFVGFIVLADVQESHAQWLLHHGVRTPGVIIGVDAEGRGFAHLYVRYADRGQPSDHVLDLDSSRVGRYHVGEAVTVFLNPSDPNDFRTAGEENDPNRLVLPAIVLMIFGLIALGSGAVMWARSRRVRHLLRENKWTHYSFRLRQSSRGPGIYMDLIEPHASLLLPGRSGSSFFPHSGGVCACGDPRRTLALWEPVADRVVFARRVPKRGMYQPRSTR